MISNPLVSIIIPTFNRGSLIGETLDSVIIQSYQNWECLVVDDGSTDDSLKIVKEYQGKDPRVKLFTRNREPKGAPVCRNIGLDHAAGEYVIYLDSDDILAPFCLKQRVEAILEFPDEDFLVFKALLFKQQPNDAEFLWNVETDEPDLIRFMRMDVLWQTTGPIYKRAFVVMMTGFREDLPFWQDFDLHLRCLFNSSSYKKMFNLRPDYFIRTGRKDTISRSTPFAATRDSLQKRIDYYLGLSEYLISTRFKSNQRLCYTHTSTLFYLSMQYFIRFSDFRSFLNNWDKGRANILSSSVSLPLTLVYALCIKIGNRISWMEKFSKGLKKQLKDMLPDYYVKEQNNLEKVKYGYKD